MYSLDWLFARFTPAQTFMILHDKPYTYAWLQEAIKDSYAQYEAAGISRGAVVALEGDFAPESVAALLALMQLGAIIVPLASAHAATRAQFAEIAEVEYVMRPRVPGVVTERTARHASHPLLRALAESGEPGLVLFSSGSTGTPKAALQRLGKLLDRHRVPRRTYTTLTFLLFDHIGGINTLFYTVANAGTMVSVAQRDPDTVCRAIAEHGVELLPATPTFLNLLLLSEAHLRHDLASLKRITYGTEPMPEETLRRLRTAFPGIALQQTYGLSELGILRSKSRSDDSLWVKVGGGEFETKVVDGILFIRADSAMAGYLNAPAPFDAEGWFNTGDAVEVDGEYLKILGRKSELINVGGEKLYPAEVESVLLEMTGVTDATVFGLAHPLTGQTVGARIRLAAPEAPADFRRRLRAHCQTRLAPYKIPTKVDIVDAEQHSERFKKMRRLASEF